MNDPFHQRRLPWQRLPLALNVGALASLAAWVLIDADFPRTVHWLLVELGRRPGESGLALMRSWSRYGASLAALKALLAVGLTAGLAAFVLLFVGPARQRGLRSWLALLTVCCAWLALGVGWSDLAWWGKQRRVAARLPEFEQAAELLSGRWPGQDGEVTGLGPFTAYPIGRPTTLLMLSEEGADLGARFLAVERVADEGGLRFALAGKERGDWLEWHPAGRAPASFTGGLGDRHKLLRSAPLGKGWHLVRYSPDDGDAD
ncbi:MAG: hypothetical protein U0836_20415 [Pirellulales bacterium]